MRVTLRHCLGAVTQQLLHGFEGNALHDQMRGKCMAKSMPLDGGESRSLADALERMVALPVCPRQIGATGEYPRNVAALNSAQSNNSRVI